MLPTGCRILRGDRRGEKKTTGIFYNLVSHSALRCLATLLMPESLSQSLMKAATSATLLTSKMHSSFLPPHLHPHNLLPWEQASVEAWCLQFIHSHTVFRRGAFSSCGSFWKQASFPRSPPTDFYMFSWQRDGELPWLPYTRMPLPYGLTWSQPLLARMWKREKSWTKFEFC